MKMITKNTHEAAYLILESGDGENTEENFEEKLIRCLADPLFLPAAGHGADAFCQWEGMHAYDISGLLPMTEALAGKALNASDLTACLVQLDNAILVLKAHMLTDADLLLMPEHVYMDPETGDLCFCPAKQQPGSFEDRVAPFVRELFLHVDLEDPQALRLADRLLRVSMEKEFRMHDLMEVIEKDTRRLEKQEAAYSRRMFRALPDSPLETAAGADLSPEAGRREGSDPADRAEEDLFSDPQDGLSGLFSLPSAIREKLLSKRKIPGAGLFGAFPRLSAFCKALFIIGPALAAVVFLRGKEAAVKVLPGALILLVSAAIYTAVEKYQRKKHDGISTEDLKFEDRT